MADRPTPPDTTLVKLINMLGAERANPLIAEILLEIGCKDISAPEDRLAFGDALAKRGGLLEVIGRSIRVQAFLLGARNRG